MHLFALPMSPNVQGVPLRQFNMRNNGFRGTIAAVNSAALNAGLNVIAVDNGFEWQTDLSAITLTDGLGINTNFTGDQMRIIAMGWEVVNITPPINAGGTVTAYKVPNALTKSYIAKAFTAGPATVYGYEPVSMGSLPPGTQPEASLFTNSRTWAAVDGLYQIATMNSIANPFLSQVPGTVGFCSVPTAAQLTGNSDRIIFLPQDSYNTSLNSAEAGCQHLFPWDISGSVFTNNTQFPQNYQITVKYYVEKVPTSADQQLLVLTHKPATYDPVILELYSRTMSAIPVGCPVDENPLGEWFESVMTALGTTLPILGAAVGTFLPGAGLIGTGLGGVATYLGEKNKLSREEEERRRKQSEADKAMVSVKPTQVTVARKANARTTPKPLPRTPKKN